MLHVILCITAMHDLRLVALACVLCGLASLTSLHMLGRAQAAKGHTHFIWVAAGGVAFGSGVWATHFISMLAYQPNVPVAFDVGLTMLSLFWAIGGGWLALLCAYANTRLAMVASGVVLGGAIGAMHFTGMAALQVPGVLNYATPDLVAAWVIGLVLAPCALLRFRTGHLVQATLLLVLAIAGLHFIAMAAVSIVTDGTTVDGLPTVALAVSVAAVAGLILISSLGGALLDQHLDRRAARDTERFRRFADATFEGLFFLEDDIVSDANLVMCRMLNTAPERVVGRPLSAFFSLKSQPALAALRAHGGEAGGAELELASAGRAPMVVDIMARQVTGGPARSSVIVVRDATERRRAEQRIKELAQTDPLTGLANRMLLQDYLSRALVSAEKTGSAVAVLCLDLDRFKLVNDLLGHHAGDCLLVEVAERLRGNTRDTDMIARLGGDEFIAVQPFSGEMSNVGALARRLIQSLSEPYVIEGRAVDISASIGISSYPATATESELLLRQADLALYRAKQEGRSCYRMFEPAMDHQSRRRRDLEQDLRQALANQEFQVHYQPIFESERLALVGYEALLRWRHPVRGNVSPAEFIPLAEECGVIRAIGQFVLETACAEAASWHTNHTVSVNLSPAQFKDQDMAAQVAFTLAGAGLAPSRLELEVTESVLIGDAEQALATLRALKSHGVKIALDDFGTGYSSLSYLRRFPFDRLKIDRSFVAELGTNEEAESIVRCIIAMARSLRLDVTAEGVETERQLTLLRAMHCGHLQGYLLGRPAPAAALPCTADFEFAAA
jgi:diguanylate cyclase (GGDEF)-like protein